jgi:hypothetical protein
VRSRIKGHFSFCDLSCGTLVSLEALNRNESGTISVPRDDEDQARYWKAAAECIELARTTQDAGTRADLLSLAQKWLDLACHRFPPDQFLALLEEYNERQLKRR